MLITTLLTLPVLAAAASFHFNSAAEFYNDLDKETMQLLFSRMILDKDSIDLLAQLVNDDRVNIETEYYLACRKFTYEHASNLLKLTRHSSFLEYHLLGPGCLSNNDVVQARKDIVPIMWPPRGFPLLVDGLDFSNMDATDTTSILSAAINQPEWWYSTGWRFHAKWGQIKDLSFWRMIPAGHYHDGNTYKYLVRSLTSTPLSPTDHLKLEQLLMKSIRILGSIYVPADDGQPAKRFVLGNLWKFAHLKDEWSKSVIGFLKDFYEGDLRSTFLPNALLQSQLLEYKHWQELIRQDHMDQTTAANDMFELVNMAFQSSELRDRSTLFSRLTTFTTFLDSLEDWSILRPMVLLETINNTEDNLADYLAKFPNDHNILVRLPFLWFRDSKGLLAIKRLIKSTTESLMEDFRAQLDDLRDIQNPYILLLYIEWINSKDHWPGFVAAHQIVKTQQQIQTFFIPSPIDPNTHDPNLDAPNTPSNWKLVFSMISFETDHAIPGTFVPSICFLKALQYYHKYRSMNWTELENKTDHKCPYPKDETMQRRYTNVLKMADMFLFPNFPSLVLVDPIHLQALIRGKDGPE